MSQIKRLSDAEYESALHGLWGYLALEDDPQKSDVIFVFGGLDLQVPARAAELYLAGLAPVVLISGGAGLLTKDVFADPEAIVFRRRMIELGVPQAAIITEINATNTGENVALGMKALAQQGVPVARLILVAKSFLMRRCRATFELRFPDATVFCCPPRGNILDVVDRSRVDFAQRLLAELQRLDTYARSGYIAAHNPPASVLEIASRISLLLREDFKDSP